MFSITKKTWSYYPLLAPPFKALGIAQFVRTSNFKTPRRYEDAIHLIVQQNAPMECHKRQTTIRVCELSYPWASIIAMLLDEFVKFPKLLKGQRNKARDKRLFHIWLSSMRFPTTARNLFPTCSDSQMPSFTHYRREDVAKVRKNPVISKLFFDIF